jgi:hypothetical protein
MADSRAVIKETKINRSQSEKTLDNSRRSEYIPHRLQGLIQTNKINQAFSTTIFGEIETDEQNA